MDSRDLFLTRHYSQQATPPFHSCPHRKSRDSERDGRLLRAAIMLTRSSFPAAVGIGFLGGVLDAVVSSSVFNPAFLISEPFGGGVCIVVFLRSKGAPALPPPLRCSSPHWRAGLPLPGSPLSGGFTGDRDILRCPALPGTDYPCDTRYFPCNALIAGVAYPAMRKAEGTGPSPPQRGNLPGRHLQGGRAGQNIHG